MNNRALSPRRAYALAASVIVWFFAIGVVLVARGGCDGAAIPPLRDAGVDAPALDASAAIDTDAAAARDSGARVPADLGAITWPEPPAILRELEAETPDAITAALSGGGTRIHVVGRHTGTFFVRASDVSIELAADASLERVYVDQGVRRVEIRGGEIGSIELAPPARFDEGAPRFSDELWVRDVRVEGVRLRAADSALVLRGHRIAVVDVEASAERYCVWVGDTLDAPSEDVTIARSRLASAGPEATVRMHDVLRAVVMDSHLTNELKHNVRVHGRSDLVFIGGNVLLGTGAMIGTQPGDALERIWFSSNTLYQRHPGSLVVERGAVAALVALGNVVYSDEFSELEQGYGDAPPRWRLEGNVVAPYREPPAR